MDTSQGRSLSLKLDFMDLFFGISSFPTMNLIPNRKTFTERKRKIESFNIQQINFFTDEKFENVYNTMPKTWMEGLHDAKMNLGNYSPSLTIDLAKAIERSMQQINYMKYPNKIIDMFNSEKISRSVNNIENLIYSKMNGDINATRDSVANFSKKNFERGMAEEKRDIMECGGDNIEITTAEPKKNPNMEGPSIGKPQVSRTWRKVAKIEATRGRGRGKIQLRKSGVSQLKHKKERLKQNLHCNIQDDIDAWTEGLQDLPESSAEVSDTLSNPTYSQSQSNRTVQKYESTDEDYPTLPQKFPSNFVPKSTKRIPKKNYDSPVQSPEDSLSYTLDFQSRRLSESSVDSEESYCIVFQDDPEHESDAVYSKRESDAADSERESDAADSERESDAADSESESDAADSESESDAADSERESDAADSEREPDAADSERELDAADSEREPDAADSERELDAVDSEREPDAADSEREPDAADSEREPDAADSEREPDAADSERKPDAADSNYESSSNEKLGTADGEGDQTNTKIRFTLEPKIHIMIQWAFAYRAARRGPWEEIARDRERFRYRISRVGKILNPILSLQHREQVYQNRFDITH